MAAAISSSPFPPQPQAASPVEDPWRRGPVPPHVKAIAGSLGGVVEACCLQPTDVVKTRLQLDRSAAAYRGMAHCAATVARAEGAAALWKGLTPFAAHLTLKYALRQGANASLQSKLRDPTTGALSTWALLAAGLGAGVAEAVLIVTPFEVVKIRLQQQRGLGGQHQRYNGPIHCARAVVREEGLRGLWAGAAPTVLRNGTNQAAMFTCKSKFDAVLWGKRDGDGKALRVGESMASGFLAAAVGPLCTGPFDVVKSRLMAQGAGAGNNGEGVRYRGMVHALRTICKEGVRALWKGLLPRLVRIPTGGALAWAVTDQVTTLYERAYLQPAAHL